MSITFESIEYQCSVTKSDIPYTLYIADSHLLLVPRQVESIHPKFPSVDISPQQIKLQLLDYWVAEYKEEFNQEPRFHYRYVNFGLEDDEVVVAAMLDGSNFVAYWEFRDLLNGGGNKFYTLECLDAKVHFNEIERRLCET